MIFLIFIPSPASLKLDIKIYRLLLDIYTDNGGHDDPVREEMSYG